MNCPTYKQLRENDTKTQAYLDLEEENKVIATAVYDRVGRECTCVHVQMYMDLKYRNYCTCNYMYKYI